MSEQIAAYLAASEAVLARVRADGALCARLAQAAELCIASLRAGGKLLLCGNGGSAADAQHLAGELVGRFARERPGLAALALVGDAAVMTAIGNDYGYDALFSRQVSALGRPGDVLIALTTSGNSPNILTALEAARSGGVASIVLTGRDGGAAAALCDLELRMPATQTPLIQQAQMALGHLLCGMIEDAMFNDSKAPSQPAKAAG